ncbi:MAG: hypothetical protein C0508_29495 [Cyanobacteria bacterium PR.023]|nr:hypothetical protein [Cyanobacteria bacterium PR.023]
MNRASVSWARWHLIAFHRERAFFLIGIVKNERHNIDQTELRLLKKIAKDQMEASDKSIASSIDIGGLVKVVKKEH